MVTSSRWHHPHPYQRIGSPPFKDESTNLGSPVPIAAGIAFGGFFVIPPGSHSLTAEFTPANPEAARPSTSDTLNFTF